MRRFSFSDFLQLFQPIYRDSRWSRRDGENIYKEKEGIEDEIAEYEQSFASF